MESLCSTNFANVLYGRTSPDKAGILSEDGTSSSNTSFAAAKKIIQSHGMGVLDVSGEDIHNGMLYTTRMLSYFYFCAGFVIACFVIAVCFSRVAHANTCFLEAAWQSAAEGSGSDLQGSVDGDKGELLGNSSTIVTRRLAMLANSRKLSISYFLFLLLTLFLFLIMGGLAANGSNVMLQTIEPMIDFKIAAYQKYMELLKMHDQQNSGADNGGQTKEKEPPSELDKIMEKLFTPQLTHDSGIFICQMIIRQTGQNQQYSVQCNYDVSRTRNKGHYDYMNALLEVKQVVDAACWLNFIMVALLVVHILNFFFLSPKSHQKSLTLVMKQLGMNVPSRGLGFGFTDLAFVAAFLPLGSRTRYSVAYRVWTP